MSGKLSVDGLLIFCEEGTFRAFPVGPLLFTLCALMISHCFSNPHPHARPHNHTPPVKKTHAALFNMKMRDAATAFLHFTFSKYRQAELSVPVFAPHPSTETICLSNPLCTACTALLLPLACQMFICILATHFMPVFTPPASTVTLGRHLVKLYSL